MTRSRVVYMRQVWYLHTPSTIHFLLLETTILHSIQYHSINSLAPKRFPKKIRKVIVQLILVIDGWSIPCKIVLKWMPVVQVMAWCRQATSHYLDQCWPRSLSPHGVIRPQCQTYDWKGSQHENHQSISAYVQGNIIIFHSPHLSITDK